MTWVRALSGGRLALLHGPARRVLFAGALLLAVAVLFVASSNENFGRMMLLMATVAGLGLGRQSVGSDRLTGRSLLYFQRPVGPVAHYGALLLLALGALGIAAAIAALAAGLAQLFGGPPYQWVHAVGALYWSALLLIIGMTVSAFVPKRDLDMMLLFLMVSAMQVLIADWLGFAGAHELLRWLLLPIDPVFGTWSAWARGNFTTAPQYAVQLVLYPLIWLGILLIRLRRQDLAAAEYH